MKTIIRRRDALGTLARFLGAQGKSGAAHAAIIFYSVPVARKLQTDVEPIDTRASATERKGSLGPISAQRSLAGAIGGLCNNSAHRSRGYFGRQPFMALALAE
jgi:hypothetical protein